MREVHRDSSEDKYITCDCKKKFICLVLGQMNVTIVELNITDLVKGLRPVNSGGGKLVKDFKKIKSGVSFEWNLKR